jgi:hypothetical protein
MKSDWLEATSYPNCHPDYLSAGSAAGHACKSITVLNYADAHVAISFSRPKTGDCALSKHAFNRPTDYAPIGWLRQHAE